MSETFTKILVKDDRIGCLTDRVSFAVQKGGANCTAMPYKAISETTSTQVYNIAVPSLETIISREVLWKSKITLKITGTSRDAGGGPQPAARKPPTQFLVNYGVTDALAAFPLHSLVSTMTSTINNNTVSINMADVLAAKLRLVDPDDLAHYNDMTPTTLDVLADYRDGVHLLPYYLAQGDANVIQMMLPNAVYAAPGAGAGTSPQTFYSYPDNVLGYDQNRLAGTGKKTQTTWVVSNPRHMVSSGG